MKKSRDPEIVVATGRVADENSGVGVCFGTTRLPARYTSGCDKA